MNTRHGWSKQTNTKKIDFSRFLCSTPARDYIFQDTPYENQIRRQQSFFPGQMEYSSAQGPGFLQRLV